MIESQEMTRQEIRDRQEMLAAKCCEAIIADGYSAKVVEDGGVDSRILVSRKLSKGWQQMGYVDICEDGCANCKSVDRQTSTIRSICQTITGAAV